ncbi:MAG: hypothetical protein PV358_11190, partial [Acidimicrobiales bacterium]|nr:hypothetical protein [Acidimicrobiales bacterium]
GAGRGTDGAAAPTTPNDPGDALDALVDQMARHGFEPVVERAPGGDRADIVLHNCPFSSVALADPDSVCGIHLGIAYGIAESLDGLVVDGLDPHDPGGQAADCAATSSLPQPPDAHLGIYDKTC